MSLGSSTEQRKHLPGRLVLWCHPAKAQLTSWDKAEFREPSGRQGVLGKGGLGGRWETAPKLRGSDGSTVCPQSGQCGEGLPRALPLLGASMLPAHPSSLGLWCSCEGCSLPKGSNLPATPPLALCCHFPPAFGDALWWGAWSVSFSWPCDLRPSVSVPVDRCGPQGQGCVSCVPCTIPSGS